MAPTATKRKRNKKTPVKTHKNTKSATQKSEKGDKNNRDKSAETLKSASATISASDSESEKLQCPKKKIPPIIRYSENDKNTKNKTPPDPPTTNTTSAPPKTNNKSVHITHTNTNMTQKTQYNVDVNNSFETLNTEITENMDFDNESVTTDEKPPPPIILHKQTTQHKTLVQEITHTVKGTFSIKYTKNTTNITIINREERTQYMNTLKEKQIEFHTYTDSTDKTHAFVIRGLAEDITTDEVTDYIKKTYNITAINCYHMKFNKHNTKPLMLLITKKDITLSHIQRRIKYILHTRVSIERRRGTRKTVQCHNCQNWGHATNNCHAKTRCMNCAGTHATKECTNNTTIKCANCGGDHTAKDTTCPNYIQRIKWLEENKTKNQNKEKKPHQSRQYQPRAEEFPPIRATDAPGPQQNAWVTRQLNHHQQQQQNQQTSQDTPTQQQQQQEPERQQQPQTNTHQTTHSLPTHTGQAPMAFTQPTNSFRELMSELKTLNTLVNIDELLRAVKTLNTQLKQSTNTLETFTIFTKFTQTLVQYNI